MDLTSGLRAGGLLLRQAALITSYAALAGWRAAPFLRWALQWRNLTLAGGAADRIGCFGPGPHVVWEATQRCNLRCAHCHAHGGARSADGELTTAEARELIRQVAQSGVRTFVFSGGEPLLRRDLFDLLEFARSVGLRLFLATNGLLVDEDAARRLRELQVGVVIGLDAMEPAIHDEIRGLPGAWEGATRSVELCAREGLYFHLNVVATGANLEEVDRVIAYGDRLGAYSHFVYRFVPMGRGSEAAELDLGAEEQASLCETLIARQRDARGIIIPVALPEHWAHLLMRRGIRHPRVVRALSGLFPGCQAGTGMTYIKPNGDVWACPFYPADVGNVRDRELGALREELAGRMAEERRAAATTCAWEPVCGGCRARSTSSSACCLAALAPPAGAGRARG